MTKQIYLNNASGRFELRDDLLTLRSAILELTQAYNTFRDYRPSRSETLTKAITETLAASAAKGETEPNRIAQRIIDILRETEERLGIKLTKEGNQ